jgi:hypothetical protein
MSNVKAQSSNQIKAMLMFQFQNLVFTHLAQAGMLTFGL